MKKILKKVGIALLLAGTIATTVGAAFADVASDRWSADVINAMAEGGLVEGFPDGLFHPEDTLSVDEFATILARASGGYTTESYGYWAYNAVAHCDEVLNALPDYGDITATNYSVGCTREVAVYMLMDGLGLNSSDADTLGQYLSVADIPDFYYVTAEYKNAIIKAYNFGICQGSDEAHTFNPQELITREEAVALLQRAGYTTAIAAPEEAPEEAKTGAELYEEIKAMGIWGEEKSVSTYRVSVTATDPKYGGIEVEFDTVMGTMWITAKERPTDLWYSNGSLVNIYGNYVSDSVDANGKVVCATGYGYEARMLVLELLEMCYPNEAKNAAQALQDMFAGNIYEYKGDSTPSALRWYDGRCFFASFEGYGYYSMNVVVAELGYEESYTTKLSATGGGSGYSPFYRDSFESAIPKYELTKW